jgi:hypothetical protein
LSFTEELGRYRRGEERRPGYSRDRSA